MFLLPRIKKHVKHVLLGLVIGFLALSHIPAIRRKLVPSSDPPSSKTKLSIQKREVHPEIGPQQLQLPSDVNGVNDDRSSDAYTIRPTLHPLEEWRHRRQTMLSKKAAKVVLFAYMRGGSSVGGELFNVEPKATMWYEPSDAFYSAYFGVDDNLPQNDIYNKDMTRRPAGVKERQWFTDFYTNMLSCQFHGLPPQVLAQHTLRESVGLSNFTACMDQQRRTSTSTCANLIKNFCGNRLVELAWIQNCHSVLEIVRGVVTNHHQDVDHVTSLVKTALDDSQTQLSEPISSGLRNFTEHQMCVRKMRKENNRCIHVAINKCHRDSIRAIQILRHRMEDLEPLILANPDIFVIHYVRDPRAIASSRTRTNFLMWDKEDKRPFREAQLLCHRMQEDLRERYKLESKYPGVFMQARYEDLITRPYEVASHIYAFIGKDVPKAWPAHARRIMNSTYSGPFSTKISNASRQLNAWRRHIPKDQQVMIQSICGDLLAALNYPLQ